MTRKLNQADRAAVDLMFDRINAAADGGRPNGAGSSDGIYVAAGAISEQRLGAVQKVLNLLAEMPSIEPPADLAVRTIARANRASGTLGTVVPPPFIDPTQPLA